MRKIILAASALLFLAVAAYFIANTVLQPVVVFGVCGGLILSATA